jgi:hypothetical protein
MLDSRPEFRKARRDSLPRRAGLLLLTLLLVGATVRILPSRPPTFRPGDLASRHSKSPRAVRHFLLTSRAAIPRSSGAVRPWHQAVQAEDLGDSGGRSPCGPKGMLPGRVVTDLTSPEYLHLYRDPCRGTSPPA